MDRIKPIPDARIQTRATTGEIVSTPLSDQVEAGRWPSFVTSVRYGKSCEACVSDDQECEGCAIFKKSENISEVDDA